MTAMAKNKQIIKFLVHSILIDMMNDKFFSFCFAMKTFMFEMLKCFSSICIKAMFIMRVKRKLLRNFIATTSGTILFPIFSFPTIFKSKFISAKFTSFCNKIFSLKTLSHAFFRTANCFRFIKAKNRNSKFFIAYCTNKIYLFFSKISMTGIRAKKVLMLFKFIRINFDRFGAKRTIHFHKQQYHTQKEILSI